MEYFVNDIDQLEQDLRNNYNFDFEIEEVTETDYEEHFGDEKLSYQIFSDDQLEVIYTIRSCAFGNYIEYTDTFHIVKLEDIKFLLFDFVDIVIIIVGEKQKEQLSDLINSLL